jgi:chromosome transmission fidelity protein 18
LGKTTLAHVVARQAGYEVMEINASDARSGSVIDDRIRPALESGCAVGSTKPVLLIIDEIDGATGAGENVCPTYVDFIIQTHERS